MPVPQNSDGRRGDGGRWSRHRRMKRGEQERRHRRRHHRAQGGMMVHHAHPDRPSSSFTLGGGIRHHAVLAHLPRQRVAPLAVLPRRRPPQAPVHAGRRRLRVLHVIVDRMLGGWVILICLTFAASLTRGQVTKICQSQLFGSYVMANEMSRQNPCKSGGGEVLMRGATIFGSGAGSRKAESTSWSHTFGKIGFIPNLGWLVKVCRV